MTDMRLAITGTLAALLLGACAQTTDGTDTGNPPTIDVARIALVAADADGRVVVEGDSGAITPGGGEVTVRNLTTGEQATAAVENDGSFSAELGGSVDDDFELTASGPDGTSEPTPIGASAGSGGTGGTGGTGGSGGTADWQTPHPCTGDEPADALQIAALSIDGDTLEITVSHGGGCAAHAYGLCWEDGWDESYPVQNGLRVLHDAGGDMCEALLSETLRFDLTPYRQAYAELYQTDRGAIQMGFDGCADGVTCSVLYDFECPADADTCPTGCRALEAAPIDADAMCRIDSRETVACLAEDAAQTDDIACAVRVRDGAVFQSPTGTLLSLGLGAVWEGCDATQASWADAACSP